jgi:hypothetical protein
MWQNMIHNIISTLTLTDFVKWTGPSLKLGKSNSSNQNIDIYSGQITPMSMLWWHSGWTARGACLGGIYSGWTVRGACLGDDCKRSMPWWRLQEEHALVTTARGACLGDDCKRSMPRWHLFWLDCTIEYTGLSSTLVVYYLVRIQG